MMKCQNFEKKFEKLVQKTKNEITSHYESH